MSKKEQIVALRKRGLSYQKIADALAVDKSYAWNVCNRKPGPPRRLLKDIPHAITNEELAARFGTVKLGCLTETMVALKLSTLGFDVWEPFIERQHSDLGVFLHGRLIRIQVKSAGYDVKSRRFRALLDTKNGKRKHIPYNDGDFEFFIVKCFGLEEYYVIPFSVGNRTGYANLYPNRDRLADFGPGLEEYRNAFHLLKSHG